MKSFKYVIQTRTGIHARPAMALMSKVRGMSSTIKAVHGSRIANAKNIMELLALRAYQGNEVEFLIEGPEEEKDAKELLIFCQNNL